MWNETTSIQEGHEKIGAKLIASISELVEAAPYLASAVLFHSEILRLADRPYLMRFLEFPADLERRTFGFEMFRSMAEARSAVKARPSEADARLLGAADVRRIVPVALAENYISQTEGFEARSRAEVVNALVRYAKGGLYERYMLALCNSQVEMIAPRRSYVRLDGNITTTVRSSGGQRKAEQVNMAGHEGVSISHSNDMYSPHIIILYVPDENGNRREARYVPPHEKDLWGHGIELGSRMYVPAGRYKRSLSIEVTGFMQEDVYDKILGTYERELRHQMM